MAACLAPGTAAYACVGTVTGVCVQTPSLGSNQNTVHDTTIKNLINNPSTTKTGKTPTITFSAPKITIYNPITGDNKSSKQTQASKAVTASGSDQNTTNTKSTTKSSDQNTVPLLTKVTPPGKVNSKAAVGTNTTAKTKTKQQSKSSDQVTVPLLSTVTWPATAKKSSTDSCKQHPQDAQCGQSQAPAPQPPVDCLTGDPACTAQPAEQTCQLTDTQQQQLLQEAMAQHAANEQLYQQLLLKALLDQAALKAGSAVLAQHLAGHTGLSPQDVADLIKNGAVGPSDMAMAALQAAQELDQHTGGHNSQNTGTTCNSAGQQQGQGGNAAPGANHSNSGKGQGQGGGQGSGDKPSTGLKTADKAGIAQTLRNLINEIHSKMKALGIPQTYTAGLLAAEKDGQVYLYGYATGQNSAAWPKDPTIAKINKIIDEVNAAHANDDVFITRIPQQGEHAEIELMNYANAKGQKGLFIGATNPACLRCSPKIVAAGIYPVTPLMSPIYGAKLDPSTTWTNAVGKPVFTPQQYQDMVNMLKPIYTAKPTDPANFSQIIENFFADIANGKTPSLPPRWP